MSLWNVFGHTFYMPKKSDGFVFVAIDGRFMAIVEHPAKTRLLSHAQLCAKNATCCTGALHKKQISAVANYALVVARSRAALRSGSESCF
jgi:hypothetical protein